MNAAIDINTLDQIPVYSPYSGQIIDSVPEFLPLHVPAILERAKQGRVLAATLSKAKRADILNTAAALIEQRVDEFAKLIALEAGKVIKTAQKEVLRCVNTLQLSANEAIKFSGEVIPFDSVEAGLGKMGFYENKPIGIVLAITPYNDPLNLVAHKLGPAIASGNSVILKPSEHTPLSAKMLCDVLFEAGLPELCISLFTASGIKLGDSLLRNDDIKMISFTGGSETGYKIARASGMVKLSFELGGCGSSIVLADCDLEQAVNALVDASFYASGQNCIGTQTILIERDIYTEFEHLFVAKSKRLTAGNPLDPNVDVGPIISVEIAQKIQQQVESMIQNKAAKLLCGHQLNGAVYQPTVLAGQSDECWLDCHEIFGPVVILHIIDNLEEGIKRSNKSSGAIHKSIFTSNINAAKTAYQQLEASMVLVNESTDFRIDAMPFGGVGSGGIGREGVKFSMQEMMQTKSFCLS